MQLSIVIVSYNVVHYLELCLDSVRDAIKSLDAEIIVIDNASVDNSVQMVHSKFPEVNVVANDNNNGFSSANNQGVAIAQGEYICILNPDTVVTEDVFEKLICFKKSKEDAGAIGVKLVNGKGKFLPESKRNLPTLQVSFSKMLGDGSSYYANHLEVNKIGAVDILVGAFMFMKRSLYNEVSGFDERYFMYGEDIDLSYTIRQLGYDNYYVGDAQIIHFKGESTIKDKRYRECFYGAMKLFYNKHFEKTVLQNLLVETGLKVAKFKSKFSTKTFHKKLGDFKNEITSYVVISGDKKLTHALGLATSKHVELAKEMRVPVRGEEFIFDASFMTYKEIIKEIITYQDSDVTYKIIPKKSTFAIGSNSSEGRGEVIQFS